MRTSQALAGMGSVVLVAGLLGASWAMGWPGGPEPGQGQRGAAVLPALATAEDGQSPQPSSVGGAASGVRSAVRHALESPGSLVPRMVPPGGGGGAPTTSEKRVDDHGGEPALDINPTDSQNLFLASNGSPVVCCFATTNGGKSWASASVPFGASDPGVAFDDAGNAYLTGLRSDGQLGIEAVRVAKSTDKGASFTAQPDAMNRQSVFTLPDGLQASVCPNNGAVTYDYPKVAADSGASSPYQGNLYVISRVYLDRNGDGACDTGPFRASFARSADGGASYDLRTIPLDEAASTDHLEAARDGTLFWAKATTGCKVEVIRSQDAGASWARSCASNPPDPEVIMNRRWVVADPSNADKVYVAYSSWLDAAQQVMHVYVVRSVDHGQTWSAPVQVDDGLPLATIWRQQVDADVSSNGRLDVHWADHRNAPTPQYGGYDGDFYYAYSTDGGATFSSNIRLSGQTDYWRQWPGNDYQVIVSSGTKAYAAYAMDRCCINGNMETYVSTIKFG